MISLLLLFLSTIVSAVLIYIIPFGLEKRQKMLISVAVPVIGSLGFAFSFIASPWQSVLVMVLLAVSAGYVMVNRTTVNLESEEAISMVMGTGNLSKLAVTHDTESIDKDKNNVPAMNEIPYLNAVPSNEEKIRMAEDISFLEARNNRDFELSELEVIPVLKFKAQKDEVDDAAYETQPS